MLFSLIMIMSEHIPIEPLLPDWSELRLDFLRFLIILKFIPFTPFTPPLSPFIPFIGGM